MIKCVKSSSATKSCFKIYNNSNNNIKLQIQNCQVTLCIPESPKQVLPQTVKSQMKCFIFLSGPTLFVRERSGSVVECLTRDRGAAGSSLTSVTALWSLSIYPSLVLVQPRKTRPCLTERLLMGRKESNQTNTVC